jgi:Ser/Thr protein kinase RdoA (MazF antagonist)
MSNILPVEYSVVSSSALQRQLSIIYDLPSDSKVSFFYRGLHDTYLVSNGSIHLMLKIYRRGWKSLENIKAELDVILALKQKGIDVAVPYKDRNGHYVQELTFPEGTRYAIISMYAPGVKLKQLNEEVAKHFGKKLASMHVAAIDMNHEGLQRNYYLGNVFNDTMESISSVLTDKQILESFRLLYFKMDSILNAFDVEELKVGICHGDAHFENAHFKLESGKITFFDFDFCGNGYLLYDVGSFCHYERNNAQNVSAFLAGYQEVLPLSPVEHKLIPFFTLLMRIFHFGARAKNADGNKNPLWPKAELTMRLKEIETEANGLAKHLGVEVGNSPM